jgi:hypothetical protein
MYAYMVCRHAFIFFKHLHRWQLCIQDVRFESQGSNFIHCFNRQRIERDKFVNLSIHLLIYSLFNDAVSNSQI